MHMHLKIMPTVNMMQLTFIFPVVSFPILPLKKEKED